MADDGESIFAKAGFDVPKASPASSSGGSKSESKPVAKREPSIFEAAGFSVPTSASKSEADKGPDTLSRMKAKAAEEGINLPTPGEAATVQPEKSTARKVVDAIDAVNPVSLLAKGAEHAIYDTLEHAASGWQQVKQGVSEIRNGQGAPSVVGQQPPGHVTNLLGETREVPGLPQYAPGGYLRVAGGAAAIPGSLVSGPVNALVTRPVTEITGNPDIGDRAGLLASSVLPLKGGGKAVEAAAPATKATNALVEMVGPENVLEAVARLRQNPRLTLADVSDPVRTATQGLIDPAQPKVQNLVAQRIKERADSRLEAANSAFTEAMGPSPDVGTMVEGLKARAREAGQQAIQPALKNAKPVDVSPVIEAIDKELKPGVHALLDPDTRLPLSDLQQELIRFKQKLTTGTEQAFDPQALHRIQSDMGDQAFQLSKSPNPKDRLLGSQLRNFNEKLIDQIDEAAGGAYRPARAKFKDAKDIHEAFDEGFDVLKNRSGQSGFDDRPAALKEWMKTATPEQVVAKRLGVRADIDQKINGVKNGALAGQTITKIPYNQEKLRTLFGDKEANRLIRVMKDAEDEAHTNAKITAGAKTAETQAGQRALAVPKVEPFQLGSLTSALLPSTIGEIAAQYMGAPMGLTGVGMLATGTGAGLLKKGGQKIAENAALNRNYEFARNALAAGPVREETINSLLSHPKVIRELKKRANALVAP